MSVINTNTKALVAQNALSINNRNLSKTMEQLSTGKRINSAADDAAGLAISNKMTSQIRGLNQAVRNANDSISLLQTAEGALVEVNNMMQRMRELAVQSANDTNSAEDRAYLQLEFAALSEEITRVRNTTQFNNMNLLDGSGKFTFHIGANSAQNMKVDIRDIAGAAGGGKAIVADITEADGTNGQISVLDFSAENTDKAYAAGDKIFLKIADTKFTYTVTKEDVDDFNGTNNDDGVGDLLSTKLAAMINASKDMQGKFLAVASTDGSNTLTVTGVDVDNPYTFTASSSQVTTIAPSSNSAPDGTNGQITEFDLAAYQTTPGTGNTAFAAGDVISLKIDNTAFSYTVTAKDVADFDATNNDDGVADLLATKLASLINSNSEMQGKFLATASTDGSNTLTITGVDVDNAFTAVLTKTGASATGVTGDISTRSGADSAISNLASAMASIDTQRAELGAAINRLTYTVDNLSNVAMKTSESRSRILDTDYAKATSDLARTQIIQQAATAMLAQANQQPSSVLSLLQ